MIPFKNSVKIMQRRKVLITGGAGFVGMHLVDYLLQKGEYDVVVFDKIDYYASRNQNKNVSFLKGNILSKKDVSKVFKKYGPFATIYHLASAMPNKEVSDSLLWETNVYGTLNIVNEAVKNKVESFIFTSSNVAYGIPKTLPASEETLLMPLEMYGKSKKQAEEELAKFKDKINVQIIRCPVIVGVGRLGLQAILYEFISENKNIYVLGNGDNRYQFVDASDVVVVLEMVSHLHGFNIFNIGADQILSLRELYQKVIDYAKSKSKIISLPKSPAIFLLAILDKLNISPLGIYQYTMISRSLYLDTTKIKKVLNWKPKKTNLDTFIENYKWYKENKGKFVKIGSGVSANRSTPKMGILKLIKFFS